MADEGGDEGIGTENGDVTGPAVEDLAGGGRIGEDVDAGVAGVGTATGAVGDGEGCRGAVAIDDDVGGERNVDEPLQGDGTGDNFYTGSAGAEGDFIGALAAGDRGVPGDIPAEGAVGADGGRH